MLRECQTLVLNIALQVPLKVSILAWQLLRDRLPTKANLVSRGILSSESHYCVSGCEAVESAQHLFLSCSTFGSLWSFVGSWIESSLVESHTLSDHFVRLLIQQVVPGRVALLCNSLLAFGLCGTSETLDYSEAQQTLHSKCWTRSRLFPIAEKILETPFVSSVREDKVVWEEERDECYSVKSGYKLAMRYIIGSDKYHVVGNWNGIWKAQAPHKARHLLWRLCRGCLPTRARLLERRVECTLNCSVCDEEIEDELHIFFRCAVARDSWSAAGLSSVLHNATYHQTNAMDRIFAVCSNESSDTVGRVAMLLWSIWHNLHKLQSNNVSRTTEADLVRWEKPALDWVKCNVDAAFVSGSGRTSVGLCFRDNSGHFMAGMTQWQQTMISSVEGEACALLLAMEEARHRGLDRVQFESDSKVLIEAIHMQRRGNSEFLSIVHDILSLMSSFINFEVKFVRRQANLVAHTLARATNSWANFHRFENILFCIEHLIFNEMHDKFVFMAAVLRNPLRASDDLRTRCCSIGHLNNGWRVVSSSPGKHSDRKQEELDQERLRRDSRQHERQQQRVGDSSCVGNQGVKLRLGTGVGFSKGTGSGSANGIVFSGMVDTVYSGIVDTWKHFTDFDDPKAANAWADDEDDGASFGFKRFVTFYFTNFPEQIRHFYLRKAFEVFGILENVVVARKRNVHSYKYGFVRFSKVRNINKLLTAINEISFGQFRIWARVARFDKASFGEQENRVRAQRRNVVGSTGGRQGRDRIRKGEGENSKGEGEPLSKGEGEKISKGEMRKLAEGRQVRVGEAMVEEGYVKGREDEGEGTLKEKNKLNMQGEKVGEDGGCVDTRFLSKQLVRKYRSKENNVKWARLGVVATVQKVEAITVVQARIVDAGFQNLHIIPDCGRFLRVDECTLERDMFDYARVLVATSSVEVHNFTANILVDEVLAEIKLLEEWGYNLGEDACLAEEEDKQEQMSEHAGEHNGHELTNHVDMLVENLADEIASVEEDLHVNSNKSLGDAGAAVKVFCGGTQVDPSGGGIQLLSVTMSSDGVHHLDGRGKSRRRHSSCPPGKGGPVMSGPWSLEWFHEHIHSGAGIIFSPKKQASKHENPPKVAGRESKRKKVGGVLCHIVQTLKKVGGSRFKEGGSSGGWGESRDDGGLGGLEKRGEVRKLISEKRPLVVCIQETKLGACDDFLCASLWGSSVLGYSFRPSVGASGGILVMWDTEEVEVWSTISQPHLELWDRLTGRLLQLGRQKVCICGDFNAVRSEAERRLVSPGLRSHDQASFNQFIEDNDLIDLPLCGCSFTWYRGDGLSMSRIDSFLLSEDWCLV
ncbi:hypothetical protein TSUD_53540 [Trifolium subterraneum]|uniref:RRM domain-containing protein n=1 Tax=Trifolium subterraneum TaxID=3900 RepID=A0A2Z6MHF1_TRISU|nr:hypothetical protein TSUD_53540 [Trifolium subterraneum]